MTTSKAVFYASVGPALTRYQIGVEEAALTRQDTVMLPANVQYAWPHPSAPFLYVATSNGGSAALGIKGDKHFLSALRIDPGNGSIEVGHLRFSSRLQRKPAATEAMYLMMRRAFELGYRRYEWKCDALNAPSRAAADRFGFTYEGIFRQATVVKGRNRDTAWYAAIDGEWPALSAAFAAWLAPSNFDEAGQQKASLRSFRRAV